MIALTIVAALASPQQPAPLPRVVVADSSSATVQSWPLAIAGDNRASIQAAIDWCEMNPGREVLTLPAGVWKTSASIEFVGDVSYRCEGATLEPLDPLTFQRSVVLAGSSDHPSGGGIRPRADDVEIIGLTIRQTAATSQNCHCLFANTGDRWRLIRVKAMDSKHEGLVSGGLTREWLWDRCEAYNCGAGSIHRSLSGAGLNCNGVAHIVIKPKTRNCGQGLEFGSTGITVIDPDIENTAQPAAPSIGINMGNSVTGLYRARVFGGRIVGYSAAMTIGNDNGRSGGIVVDGVELVEGGITFRGGKPDNIVPTADQGPDLEPSIIRRVVFTTASEYGGAAVVYNPGPAANDAVFGRADLIVEDCEAVMPNGEPDWMYQSAFGVFGNVTGNAVFRGCVVRGPRGAGHFGDFHLSANNANLLRPTMPNVRTVSCRAIKADGSPRQFRAVRDVE